MYTIYHIPAKSKIGCTEQEPEIRVKAQGFTDFEILEIHEDIYIASNREIELQKQYGYKVDTIPYWKAIQAPTFESRSRGGKTSGKIAVESGQLASIASLAGKIGGKINGKKHVESGHWASIRHLGAKARAKITKEQVEQIKKEFIKGSKEYGIRGLAKKYGVSPAPISSIIKGTFTNYKEPENE